MNREILFLAHRIPFPPDRGDKIRSHHVLRALAKLAPVHVGCFAETSDDRAHEGELARLAASHCLVQRGKPLPFAGIEAIARGLPVSLTAFHNSELAAWVETTLRTRPIGTIYVFSGQMGQYVPPHWEGRLVVDLVDVDSAKFEQYARERGGLMAGVNAREARLLGEWEARLARIADRTLLISQAEAALFRSRHAGEDLPSIAVLGNGIDAGAFDPARWQAHEALAEAAGPHLVFTGQMDYPPNVAAAARAVHEILPRVQAVHPRAEFHVIGRAPAAEVRALGARPGVRVWGEVPAVQPFLAAADLVVAPLALARGVQNKVLEAMAMARPVLLTPQAATGIGAESGKHWLVAESDGDLVARALLLLADPGRRAALGAQARRFVVEQMSWEAMLAPLPQIVKAPRAEGRRHAA